jgi:hypothetical protein
MGGSPVLDSEQLQLQHPNDDDFASPQSPVAPSSEQGDQDDELSALLEQEEEDERRKPADGEEAPRGGAHAGGAGEITSKDGARSLRAAAIEPAEEVKESSDALPLASARSNESLNPSESSALEGETSASMTELEEAKLELEQMRQQIAKLREGTGTNDPKSQVSQFPSVSGGLSPNTLAKAREVGRRVTEKLRAEAQAAEAAEAAIKIQKEKEKGEALSKFTDATGTNTIDAIFLDSDEEQCFIIIASPHH